MRAAKKSWRHGQAVSKAAAVSETCFGTGHGTNQWYFSLQIFSIFTSVHSTHLGPTNCFSPLSGLWGGQEGLKANEGRRLGYTATRNAGKRAAVYYQRPGDAERYAHVSTPPPGPDPVSLELRASSEVGATGLSPYPTLRGMRTLPARQPPGQQFRLPSVPTTTPHAAHRPPRVTSKARVVVSGPNLSDFDRPSAQGGQDETLAQEVAAREAEGVCLGRHVRALRKGAGHQDAATSNGR